MKDKAINYLKSKLISGRFDVYDYSEYISKDFVYMAIIPSNSFDTETSINLYGITITSISMKYNLITLTINKEVL